MAFNAAPTEVITGWSEDGTDVTFPIADVAELDATEADAATGDSRRIMFAFQEQFYQWYAGLATADKPGKMSITKSVSLQPDGTYRLTYNNTFYTQTVSQEVLDEE